jgi:cytochrome P450
VAFFNPFRPAYIEDPYPSLQRLRAEEPVHWSRELGAWVLTRYEDCLRVLQDDDAFSSDPMNARGEFGQEVARKRAETPLGLAPIMGNTDPPDHSRLRTIVNRGFTPRVMEAMRPGIERVCGELPSPPSSNTLASLARAGDCSASGRSR